MTQTELQQMISTKVIVGVDFSGQTLEKVDFSGCRLERVNFKGCEMIHCRFRKAKISWSDFRYVNIQHGTFEEAEIEFCASHFPAPSNNLARDMRFERLAFDRVKVRCVIRPHNIRFHWWRQEQFFRKFPHDLPARRLETWAGNNTTGAKPRRGNHQRREVPIDNRFGAGTS